MRGLRERRCGRSAAPYARRRRREAGVVRGRARATPRLASRPLPPPRGIPASHYTKVKPEVLLVEVLEFERVDKLGVEVLPGLG